MVNKNTSIYPQSTDEATIVSKMGSCDFSLDHYKEILEALRNRFQVVRFRDFERYNHSENSPFAILRHDIDFSIENALDVARIEHEVEVQSTYFVRLDARHYNPFYLPSMKGLQQIIDWGHDIGLHYSTASNIFTGESCVAIINRQLRVLRELLSYDVKIGAAHETTRLKIDTKAILKETELRMEAYEPRFVKEMKYISDSSGRWREGCACQWLDRGLDLCILTHPFWWYTQTPLERY